MRHHAFPDGITRAQLIDWYRSARARSRMLFDIVVPEGYYDRPIALRHPVVFYEGHLPAFSVNTLVKGALGRKGVDAEFETLFERGIDPEDETAVARVDAWPSRERVRAFAAACDELVERALGEAAIVSGDESHSGGEAAAFTIIEHELMHHETFAYMLHALPYERKLAPADTPSTSSAEAAAGPRSVRIPAGRTTVGGDHEEFGWDNEFPSFTVEVAEFEIDVLNVTNGEYLEYIEATGANPPHFWVRGEREWYWRGMFGLLPLPLRTPVWVTHEEATTYARWRGMRLPSEAEYHRATYGTPSGEERLHPWGDDPPRPTRGNFDFASWDPLPAGSYPDGVSAWGIHDLVGNGWEWTASPFAAFPGFEPMPTYPAYSVDFFDGAHYVLKGASPVTARELVRRSFRNWFRPQYPYVFAKFRCVR